MLERLEIDEESGYTRVRMSDGTQGWLKSQYLVSEPIARNRIKALSEKHSRLEAEYQQALLRMQEQNEIHDSNLTQIQALSTENELLNKELRDLKALAENVISINDMNLQLQTERDQLHLEIDDLATSISELKDTSDQDWFLRGAGTILLGLLVGFLVSRGLYSGRRSGWN